MSHKIKTEVLSSANKLISAWDGAVLNRDDFNQLMTLAKENGDWVQIAAIALATACILDEANQNDKG